MFAGTEGPSAGGVDREALKNERLEKARRYRQKGGGPKEGELLSDSDVKSVLDDASIPDTEYKSDAERMNTSNEDILNDWEKHMHDFVPEDMSTLVVPAHTIVTVYEDIEHTKPTVIKGAFYSQGYKQATRLGDHRGPRRQCGVQAQSRHPRNYSLRFHNQRRILFHLCQLAQL